LKIAILLLGRIWRALIFGRVKNEGSKYKAGTGEEKEGESKEERKKREVKRTKSE
jgi:hypothetical protein